MDKIRVLFAVNTDVVAVVVVVVVVIVAALLSQKLFPPMRLYLFFVVFVRFVCRVFSVFFARSIIKMRLQTICHFHHLEGGKRRGKRVKDKEREREAGEKKRTLFWWLVTRQFKVSRCTTVAAAYHI